MFKALVEKYNVRMEQDVLVSNVLEDFSNEIIDLFQALKKEKESFADLGIDFEEKAFYDILKALTIKYDFEYPDDKMIVLAQKVKEVVDDKAKYTDWSKRDDIKAELKVDLIILLAEHGYPPVDRDEVIRRYLNRQRISRSSGVKQKATKNKALRKVELNRYAVDLEPCISGK